MNRILSAVLKIIVFILFLIFLDQVFGKILRKLYFQQKTGQTYSLNYGLKECNADILIFGASKAQHNYDPRIISDSLKMSCYNAGQDGGHSILLQYAQIKIITDRYSPKIVILDFSVDRIIYYPFDYDKLSILLPYYADYPDLQPLIQLRNQYEKIKLLSAVYPFNSNVINIIRYNTRTKAARKLDFEGFIPLENKVMNADMLKPGHENSAIEQMVIDTNKVKALRNIIGICKEKNISLFIICSPIFHMVNEKPSPLSLAGKLSMEIMHHEKLDYRDFSDDSLFIGHMELFADKVHLNAKGATLFSTIISSWIKNKINEVSLTSSQK